MRVQPRSEVPHRGAPVISPSVSGRLAARALVPLRRFAPFRHAGCRTAGRTGIAAAGRIAAAFGVFILIGCAGHRADAAGLTLPQLIEIAIGNNKELRAARQVEAQAHARLVQAGLLPNPRLETATNSTGPFNYGGEYTASAGFSQQFPIAGRIARQKDVARVDIDLALEEIREAELKLAGEVASAFYRVLALNRQISVRDQLMAADRKLLAVSRNRFKAGEVSELDVNAAQLELQRLDQEGLSLTSDRTKQLGELNQLLGRPAYGPLLLDDSLPAMNVLPNLAAQQRQALERRPELRSAILAERRARADQGLARAERWEDWTVGLGAERSRIAVDGQPRQASDSAVALTLSIPLPLWNQNQGRIAEAGSKRTQAEMRAAALELSIRNEVESLMAELVRLRQILVNYQRSMLATSKKNIMIAQEAYSKGQIAIVEVVQAERQYGELNISYLNVLDQYLQALGKLHAATADYIKPAAQPAGSVDATR